MLHAHADAFNAYKILYYDVENFVAIQPSHDGIQAALTVQENLSGTSYLLSEKSLALLASYYTTLDACDSNNDNMIDPATDIRIIEPEETGKPMYPDFPRQVMAMDEADFRADQIMHYISTYGVEQILSAIGIDAEVQRGWRPDVSATEKTRQDETIAQKQIIELVLSRNVMLDFLKDELSRPKRMSKPALNLLDEIISKTQAIQLPNIAFHENMMGLALSASERDSSHFASVLANICQHPGDLLKIAITVKEHNDKNHLFTRQKKALCQAFEQYDARSIASNIVDLGKKGRQAATLLSIQRFGGNALKTAHDMVEKGDVKSYNTRVEDSWKGFAQTGEYKPLLDVYGERPGILLRSLARLLKADIPEEAVFAELSKHSENYSLATLITLITAFSSRDLAQYANFANILENPEKKMRAERMLETRLKVANLVKPILKEKLSSLDTPLKNKAVFVEPGPFSLQGSVICPNSIGNTSSAYPPAGMAYDVPADKTVRFFTYWNDRSQRVDVDIHFLGKTISGERFHIGWNANYNSCGMTTSGDITDSENAAEYLDADMKEAMKNVLYVYQHQHIYSGRANWKDIETCYCGAMLVSHKDEDISLYNGENILFRDDMTGTGNTMNYALIDFQEHWIRIMRGENFSFRTTDFNLKAYIELLLEAQDSKCVNSREEADIILSVPRFADDDDGICLIDEGFFIQ